MEKYHIEKNTVQETLVIPLYGRKVCSEHFPQLFSDPEAERLCGMLDYDFSEKGKRMEGAAGLPSVIENRRMESSFRFVPGWGWGEKMRKE